MGYYENVVVDDHGAVHGVEVAAVAGRDRACGNDAFFTYVRRTDAEDGQARGV